MISIKCTYENGDTTKTDINCTFEEAKEYYLGECFNLGIGGNDNMQKCVKIEKIDSVFSCMDCYPKLCHCVAKV